MTEVEMESEFSNRTKNKRNKLFSFPIAQTIVVLGIALLFLLPARYYIAYSLAKDASSNIVVNYVNFVDLAAIAISFICVAFEKKKVIRQSNIRIIAVFFIVSAIDILALSASGNSVHIGEIVSKLFLLVSAAVIVEYIHNELDEKLKKLFYLIPLVILVSASFFLSGYGGYAVSNRVGSLGFGSNETAMLACALIGIALFMEFKTWIKLGMSILGFACILTVSSRRGILVAIILLLLSFVIKLFTQRRTITRTRLVLFSAGLAAIAFALIRYYWTIYNYIMNSPLMRRFIFSSRVGIDITDTSDRSQIFKDCIARLNSNPVLGFMGSDKLFGQGTYTHTHNLFLQCIVVYGYLFGMIICLYFISVLYKSLKLLSYYFRNRLSSPIGALYAIFFLVYIVFDMYGYLLWNPKGLLWILITTFLINREYKEQIKDNRLSQNSEWGEAN